MRGRAARRGAGFSLMSALFLLVAIGTAGAFMVRLAGVQRTTTTFALLGPKAYHAARSGIEWNLHRALTVPGSCPVGPPVTTAFSLTEGGLAGFDVTVTCEAGTHIEGATTKTLYRFTALAERGAYGDRDYVSRRLETRVSDG